MMRKTEVELKERVFPSCTVRSVQGIIFVAAFFLIFNRTLNYDEFFSVNWTALPWGEMWKQIIGDVHPPLYYIGLKLFQGLLGTGIWQGRLFSLIAFAGILEISHFVQKEFGTKSAVWYLLFVCGNPFMFQKAAEIRMYMWTSLWVEVNAVFFYRLIKNEKKADWIFFCITGLAAAYTHYFGLLMMVCTYMGVGIYFVIKKKKENVLAWSAMCLLTAVFYLPWLFVALKQVSQVNRNYWIEWPKSRLGVMRELFYSIVPYSEKIYMLLLVLLLICSLICFMKMKDKTAAWWCLVMEGTVWALWLFGILYMTFMGRPILVSRYLIPGILLSILGSCLMVKKFRIWLVVLIESFLVLIGGITFGDCLNSQMKHTTEHVVEFASQNIRSGAQIYYLDDQFGYLDSCVRYYIPWAEPVILYGDDTIDEKGKEVWFLYEDRMAEDGRNEKIIDDMTFYGEYAFGGEKFKIYGRKQE